VNCGRTKLPEQEIGRIISDLLEDYPGRSYDVLRRNCCHFAEDFCLRLGVGGIPAWVHRLARVGANVDAMVQAARSVKDQLYGSPPQHPWERRPSAPLRSVLRDLQNAVAAPSAAATAAKERCPRGRRSSKVSRAAAVASTAAESGGSGMGIFGVPKCVGTFQESSGG